MTRQNLVREGERAALKRLVEFNLTDLPKTEDVELAIYALSKGARAETYKRGVTESGDLHTLEMILVPSVNDKSAQGWLYVVYLYFEDKEGVDAFLEKNKSILARKLVRRVSDSALASYEKYRKNLHAPVIGGGAKKRAGSPGHGFGDKVQERKPWTNKWLEINPEEQRWLLGEVKILCEERDRSQVGLCREIARIIKQYRRDTLDIDIDKTIQGRISTALTSLLEKGLMTKKGVYISGLSQKGLSAIIYKEEALA